MSVAQLKEAVLGAPTGAARLIHKGKELADDQSLAGAGVLEGSKLMLLNRSGPLAGGGAPASGRAQPTAGVAQGACAEGVGAEEQAQPAAEARHPGQLDSDKEGVLIKVLVARKTYEVRLSRSRTIAELKGRLQAVTGARPSEQRLIYKGKELAGDVTIEGGGLRDEGRVMLLFKEGFHKWKEGEHVVKECAGKLLPSLQSEVRELSNKREHRLVDGDEVLALVGAVDGRVQDAILDLENAFVSPAVELERAAALKSLKELLSKLDHLRTGAGHRPT